MADCHTRRSPPKRFRQLATLALLTVAGCGGTQRLPVAGIVTVDGVPVYRGSVNFVRSAGGGPSTGAGIEDGKFVLPAEHGLEPGEYRATVQALSRTGQTIQDPLRGPVDEVVSIPLADATQLVVLSAENAGLLSLELARKP